MESRTGFILFNEAQDKPCATVGKEVGFETRTNLWRTSIKLLAKRINHNQEEKKNMITQSTRKTLWLLFSFLLVLSMLLAACQPAATPTATPPPEEKKPFEGVTINLLQETVPDLEYFKKFLPEFEEKTGMKVNIEEVTYTAMHEKLIPQLSLAEGQGAYDVIIVDKQWVGEFLCADWLLPLDDYIKRDGFDTSVYVPAMFEMLGAVNGVTYMLPYYNYSMGLVYRTDIFTDPKLQEEYKAQFGVPLEVPKTLDEHVQVAKFLTRDTNGDGTADQYGLAMQLARFPSYAEYMHLLHGQGKGYYDENWKAEVNSEAGMKAINSLLDLYKNATTPAATGYFFNEQMELFSQGNAAMIVTYSWAPPTLADPNKSKVAGKVAIAVNPGGHGMQGGWGWAIPRSAPNKDAAWEFLKWVESADIAKRRALEGGSPTRTDVFNDPEVLAKWPHQKGIMEWVETGMPFPIVCRSQEIIDVLSLNTSEALAGNKTPEQAMNDAAAAMNEIVVDDPLIKK